jgi:uncharacterized membrane protein
MKLSVRNIAEAAVLCLISAILFVAFFHLNDVVFGALEHSEGVNWIFLPAGFRILLVLCMGIPACVGILLGNLYLDFEHLQHGHGLLTTLTAIVSGFTPWLVMKGMNHWKFLNVGLQDLTHQQLVNFTLIYAAANALLHQLLWLFLTAHEHQLLVEIWPMFVGDVLGALIMLYAFKGLLGMLKLRSRDRSF